MFIQARRTVKVQRWGSSGFDSHNNPIDGWTAPKPVRVYGWEVPRTAEPLLTGHDRVTVEMSMFVPPGTDIASHDRVILDGRTFEVIGEIEEAGNGPFAFNPGATVQLRRVEG